MASNSTRTFSGFQADLKGLTFVCSHVAAASLALSRTRLAALVRCQQLSVVIRASARVARVNGGTAFLQRHGLRRSTVFAQRSQLRILLVQIASTSEIACKVAAQVVAVRTHGA